MVEIGIAQRSHDDLLGVFDSRLRSDNEQD